MIKSSSDSSLTRPGESVSGLCRRLRLRYIVLVRFLVFFIRLNPARSWEYSLIGTYRIGSCELVGAGSGLLLVIRPCLLTREGPLIDYGREVLLGCEARVLCSRGPDRVLFVFVLLGVSGFA